MGMQGAATKRIAAALALVMVALLATFVVTPSPADAWPSDRQDRCLNRADRYAADDHPELTPEEIQTRTDWLYEQCAENAAIEAIAEEQGAMAPELFPNTPDDRHAHPLHCMSLADDRFGMHNNHNSPNPPADANGPGGAAALNIPGEFMYAHIDGKARLMVRYVVWTIDDIDGNVVTPVKINQQPTYQMTPQIAVAVVDFAEAYVPTSIWVELPDTMAVANQISGVLPGRRLASRTWMESKCHDKRSPTVVPQMLLDHAQSLGWLDTGAQPQTPRAIQFTAAGDPSQAASWSLTEVPVTLPNPGQIMSKGGFRWFYDSDVTYEGGDTLGPVLTTAYSPGAVFTGPDVALAGTAADPSGVSSVSLTIANEVGEYLQANGSFGPTPADLAADLSAPGGPTTAWDLTVALPPGSYDAVITGTDTLGNSASPTNAPFVVDPAGPDVEAPTVDMDHARDTVFVGPSVTISGWAADDRGVTDILVTFKDRATKLWLQPDGSMGPDRVFLPVTIDNAGASFTTWSTTVSLQAAGYNVESFAYDAAGNVGDNPTWKKFDVIDPTGDAEPPAVAADHAAGAQFIAPDVTLTGTATDNVSVSAVVVTIADSSGEYLQPDGTFASGLAELPTVLDSPSGTSTDWSLAVSLDVGEYDLDIFARDAAGNEAEELDADFVVTDVVDVVDPVVDLDHAKNTEFTGPDITLSGTASDDVGVTTVQVKIKDRDTGLWLQSDGSFDTGVVWHPATIANPGATAVTFTIDFTLSPGRYNPVAEAADAAGNDGTQTVFRPIVVVDAGGGPDVLDPEVDLDHAKNTEFTGPDITLSGTASDDIGVTTVQVKIKDRDTGLWLQSDGSFDTGVVWHPATIANPGATAVTFTIDFTLPPGRYNPVAEAADAAGNDGTQTVFRPIRVV